MAAGKSLWVKLRYRIRPLSASKPVQALDPLKTEASIRSSLASPVFDDSLDFGFDSNSFFNMPTDPAMIATSIEHPHQTQLPTPPMVPITTADLLAQRKRRKGESAPKRSLSTPNARGPQNGESNMTLAEKRRNKLGYHRTSIACSKFGKLNLRLPAYLCVKVIAVGAKSDV